MSSVLQHLLFNFLNNMMFIIMKRRTVFVLSSYCHTFVSISPNFHRCLKFQWSSFCNFKTSHFIVLWCRFLWLCLCLWILFHWMQWNACVYLDCEITRHGSMCDMRKWCILTRDSNSGWPTLLHFVFVGRRWCGFSLYVIRNKIHWNATW